MPRSIPDSAAPSTPRFNLRALMIPLVLVVLAIGGGGIAQALGKSDLAASSVTVITVVVTIAAIALSYYVIYGLGGIKQQAQSLLAKVAPLVPERADMGTEEREEMKTKLNIRLETESAYGRGVVAERQAQAGRVLNWAAIAANLAMLATSVTGKNTLGWLLSNTLLTNGANLLGFVFFTTLGERNRLLMLQQHTNEIAAKDAVIRSLEEGAEAKDAALKLEKRKIESLSAQKAVLEGQLEALSAQLRAAGLSPVSLGEGLSLARATEERTAAGAAAGSALFRRPSRLAPESAAGSSTAAAVAASEVSAVVAHSP